MEYLIWFELCPLLKIDPETGLPKIEWDSSKDDPNAKNEIVRLAKLLGRLRCHVEIWSQGSREYKEFEHSLPSLEDPRRAATCLYNLTRGYALTRGRNYVTMDDLHLAIKVALTTGSKERVAVFDFLVSRKGVATLSNIANALTMSKSTALKYMTELTAVGLTKLVDVIKSGNPTQQIRLLQNYSWLYSDAFLKLKGDYSPVDRSKYHLSEFGDEEDLADKTRLFWEMFGELEAETTTPSMPKLVELSRLLSFILNRSYGIFDGRVEIEIFVKKMIADGKIVHALGEEDYYVRAEREGQGEQSSRKGSWGASHLCIPQTQEIFFF